MSYKVKFLKEIKQPVIGNGTGGPTITQWGQIQGNIDNQLDLKKKFDDINTLDTAQANKISAIETKLLDKADLSALDAEKQRIDGLIPKIDKNTADIALKADITALDALQQQVDGLPITDIENSITDLETELNKKANQADLTATNQEVDAANKRIDALPTSADIDAKIAPVKTIADTNKADITGLNTKTDATNNLLSDVINGLKTLKPFKYVGA